MTRFIIMLMTILLSGCGPQDTGTSLSPVQKRTDIISHWAHNVGGGTPHRMSALRDGTEILSVGHHSHGKFIMLVRYQGDDEFRVYNQDGELTEPVMEGDE